MMANVRALKHFLPEQLKPEEAIYVSIRDRRKVGRGIRVVFALLKKGEIEAVEGISKPSVEPEPYNILRDFENQLRLFIQSSLWRSLVIKNSCGKKGL